MSNEELADKIIGLVTEHTLRVDRAPWPETGFVEWLEQQRQEIRAKVVALLAPRVEQSPELRPAVQEIVAEWLKQHGYDGLYLDDCFCGSLVDLMPCCEPSPRCKPGYRCWCPEEGDYGIGPERGEKPEEEPTDGS
ncbi:MAG TPA: hypothetical protein VM487_17290 [Phycisphaerae bacterium]|nr:hypothetical protein [Phycisphaerae bacterium]